MDAIIHVRALERSRHRLVHGERKRVLLVGPVHPNGADSVGIGDDHMLGHQVYPILSTSTATASLGSSITVGVRPGAMLPRWAAKKRGGFGVANEATDTVLEQYAVAAEQFAHFASLVAEECFDRRCCFYRSRHHEQVSIIDHLQSGIWNEPRQNAAVDWRHQRIILSHQHQSWLPQRREPRQTGPPGHRQKLVQIAEVGCTK